MAYIGDKPSQTLASPTSQYFNGDGSTTAFTLNRPVNVAEDLEVFVDNVQQEPGSGKSYTATGTSLTFDAAPSAGTANVYVVYRGLAEVTTRLEHDPNAALAATTGTFSGDLTVDTNTLYVDSTSNRVGIGTTSPAKKLHLTNTQPTTVSATNVMLEGGTNGYGAGVAFGARTSAGGTLVEMAKITADGEDAFNTTASTQDAGLRFFTALDGSLSERLRINSSGNVMVGSTSAVDVSSGTIDGVTLKPNNVEISRDGGTPLLMRRRSSNGEMVAFRRDTTFVGSISVTTTSTAYNTSSDYRLKENVTDITGATDRLKQLNPVRFNFIADADTTVDGFLAHEVHDVVPEAVTGTKDAVDADGNPVYQGIDQSKLVPLLVATIQELEARIAALESA